MLNSFSILTPDSNALPSFMDVCDKPFGLGFNFMHHYKNLSLENIVEEVDGIIHVEEWKDIPDYEGFYQASTFGRIKVSGNSHPFILKVLKLSLHKNGYIYCHLTKKGNTSSKRVHRLIGQTFIPNPYNKPEINHKFGNKYDNRVIMIEWSTKSENMKHAFKTNLNKSPKYWQGKFGVNHHRSKKVNQLDINGQFIKWYGSYQEAERETKVAYQNIVKVCDKKRLTAGGYKWENA